MNDATLSPTTWRRTGFLCRSAWTLALPTMCLWLSCLSAVSPAHGNELIDKIIDSIAQNYSRLGGIQATIEEIYVDPNVKEREVITVEDHDRGTKIVMTREPYKATTSRVLMRAEDLRTERIEPLDAPQGHVWTFFQGVWTQYSPESKMAWIRTPEQMPGMPPRDPRELPATAISERFADQLRNSKVIETRSLKEADGREVVEVLLEHAAGRREGLRCRCRFDPSMNFLPTKAEYLGKDGSVNLPISITYQEVMPKSAWFLREAVMTYASKQTTTIRTKGQLHIHQKIADEAFEMDLPEGTLVRDSVHRSVHRTGQVSAPDTDTLIKVGDRVPDFTLTTLDARTVRMSDLKGKTVVIHFFTTWCGFCLAETPRVQKELWERFQPEGLVLLAIGREHPDAELADFQKAEKLTFPIGADPDRKIYATFATKGVPRSYIVSSEGTVVYQSRGYNHPEFTRLIEAVESQLRAPKAASKE